MYMVVVSLNYTETHANMIQICYLFLRVMVKRHFINVPQG
jgi:hypothetical protein